MVIHLPFERNLITPEGKKKGAPCRADQNLEKVKNLVAPSEDRYIGQFSQDKVTSNAWKSVEAPRCTPTLQRVCKATHPNGHSLLRRHLCFLLNFDDFLPILLHIQEYLQDAKGLEEQRALPLTWLWMKSH